MVLEEDNIKNTHVRLLSNLRRCVKKTERMVGKKLIIVQQAPCKVTNGIVKLPPILHTRIFSPDIHFSVNFLSHY